MKLNNEVYYKENVYLSKTWELYFTYIKSASCNTDWWNK